MKKIIFIILTFLFFVSCKEKVVDASNLQDRNGVFYVINGKEPFTGKGVEYYDDGQIKAEVRFKNGIRYGTGFMYYENGVINYEFFYDKKGNEERVKIYTEKGELIEELTGSEDGDEFNDESNDGFDDDLINQSSNTVDVSDIVVRHNVIYLINSTTPYTGNLISYHSNGQVERTAYVKDGNLEGTVKYYEYNGALSKTMDFNNGRANGYEVEYFTTNNTIYKKNLYKNGRLNGLSTHYHANGNIKGEYNYKDGVLNGLTKRYYSNGQLDDTGNYSNGKKVGKWDYYTKNGDFIRSDIFDDKGNEIMSCDINGNEIDYGNM